MPSAFCEKKGSGTHLRFGNALSQFVLLIRIKYTNKLSLGRKGVETAFPLKKALAM